MPDRFLEVQQLAFGRKRAAEEKIAYFFKAEPVLALEPEKQVENIIAAIGQPSVNGLALAFVEHVAVDIAQLGNACQHACAVRVA